MGSLALSLSSSLPLALLAANIPPPNMLEAISAEASRGGFAFLVSRFSLRLAERWLALASATTRLAARASREPDLRSAEIRIEIARCALCQRFASAQFGLDGPSSGEKPARCCELAFSVAVAGALVVAQLQSASSQPSGADPRLSWCELNWHRRQRQGEATANNWQLANSRHGFQSGRQLGSNHCGAHMTQSNRQSAVSLIGARSLPFCVAFHSMGANRVGPANERVQLGRAAEERELPVDSVQS